MAITCTRCESTGFLNFEQAPDGIRDLGVDAVNAWMLTDEGKASDVAVCDCCGDGTGWYGTPGEHYNNEDPSGRYGSYAYNGGLCECD